jgi:hypothetical protein
MLSLILMKLATQYGTYVNDVSFLKLLATDPEMREGFCAEVAHQAKLESLEFGMQLLVDKVVTSETYDAMNASMDRRVESMHERAGKFLDGITMNLVDPNADHPYVRVKMRAAPSVMATPGIQGMVLNPKGVTVYVSGFDAQARRWVMEKLNERAEEYGAPCPVPVIWVKSDVLVGG